MLSPFLGAQMPVPREIGIHLVLFGTRETPLGISGMFIEQEVEANESLLR